METKRTNRELLAKGLKILIAALICLFSGPTLLHIALSNKEKALYIPILIVASIICIMAIVLIFKGIQTILNSMFNND